jgi:hypothetical protein
MEQPELGAGEPLAPQLKLSRRFVTRPKNSARTGHTLQARIKMKKKRGRERKMRKGDPHHVRLIQRIEEDKSKAQLN